VIIVGSRRRRGPCLHKPITGGLSVRLSVFVLITRIKVLPQFLPACVERLRNVYEWRKPCLIFGWDWTQRFSPLQWCKKEINCFTVLCKIVCESNLYFQVSKLEIYWRTQTCFLEAQYTFFTSTSVILSKTCMCIKIQFPVTCLVFYFNLETEYECLMCVKLYLVHTEASRHGCARRSGSTFIWRIKIDPLLFNCRLT
jgi:hypothetical protein